MLKRAVPVFIANPKRRAALTRVVHYKGVVQCGSGRYHEWEETEDGPFNSLRGGPLWKKGARSLHQQRKWHLEDPQ